MLPEKIYTGRVSCILIYFQRQIIAIATKRNMEEINKVTNCLWAELSFTDVESLVECQKILEFRSKMAPMLGGGEYEPSNRRLLIELDLFYYLIQFAKSNDFNHQQISTLFSIVRTIHKTAISTPCNNLKETIEEFYRLLLHHSANRPPYSIGVFTTDQVKLITDYVLNTYFKHFKFYKYVYTKRVQLDITIQYPGIPETPQPPTPEDKILEETEPPNEDEKVNGDGTDEGPDKAQPTEETNMSDKEKELTKIIQSHLNEQLVQLKATINEQLSIHDHKVSEKIQSMESALGGKSKGKKH